MSRVASFVNIEMEHLQTHLREVLADTKKRVIRMSNSPQNDSLDKQAINRAMRRIESLIECVNES